ncbi:uncharacterized protein J7T54_003381 [Emericellopsis cladophorae]|uniref:Uncharacterized protein n=1 Tax=Emericellopsis cladophorae TaxID=2686198 RepID=A0A9P9XVI6_9HYPO|nr:uncharacterized protein J7T54_003381 [Emericellopsis cladophorae]KAI6778602.1 hypothetical protein J7T54_003381 [Emericellopsis cladophorae]
MPSMKNPNGPSKNRLAARAASAKKRSQQASHEGRTRITKNDAAHGAREGLRPNSGPGKKLSSKKQRKLEKKMGYAMKRKEQKEGVVEMKDAPAVEEATEDGEGDVDIQ